jgi:hypothetical protein
MTDVDAAAALRDMAEETGLRAPDHLAARRSGPVPADRPGCCADRSSEGWSPPPLPADTQLKRLVDRFLPRGGLPVVVFLRWLSAR